MKRVLFFLWCGLVTFSLQAQDSQYFTNYEELVCLDNSNKVFVDIKAKNPEYVVQLEKDYIVSSDRVKEINERFTEQEFAEGRIITVEHKGMENFSDKWLKMIKVLINNDQVIKLKEHEEGNFLMLVSADFDRKVFEKIASKADWTIQLAE